MSIYGPCETANREEENLSEYAKTTYVNTRVRKTGDVMTGDLNMGGKLVKGLPTTYPPIYRGDEAVSWIQATGLIRDASVNLVDPTDPSNAATKRYVDSRKPIITLWAEEKDSIDNNEYEWSFGNGSAGATHRNCGYTMMTSGRVIRMGLVASSSSTVPNDITVNIVVNGVEKTAYGITKAGSMPSGFTVFEIPMELNRGDVVNFRSATTNSSVSNAIVSLLIELDLYMTSEWLP